MTSDDCERWVDELFPEDPDRPEWVTELFDDAE